MAGAGERVPPPLEIVCELAAEPRAQSDSENNGNGTQEQP
jgi:hypothetical protein